MVGGMKFCSNEATAVIPIAHVFQLIFTQPYKVGNFISFIHLVRKLEHIALTSPQGHVDKNGPTGLEHRRSASSAILYTEHFCLLQGLRGQHNGGLQKAWRHTYSRISWSLFPSLSLKD